MLYILLARHVTNNLIQICQQSIWKISNNNQSVLSLHLFFSPLLFFLLKFWFNGLKGTPLDSIYIRLVTQWCYPVSNFIHEVQEKQAEVKDFTCGTLDMCPLTQNRRDLWCTLLIISFSNKYLVYEILPLSILQSIFKHILQYSPKCSIS